MNGYVMEYGEKRYATNADNIMEAEEKLFIHLEVSNLESKIKTIQIESLSNLPPDIDFF